MYRQTRVCSVVGVACDPLCQETTPFHYDQAQLTCSDFTSAEQLEASLPERPNGDKIELLLKDSRLQYIPRSVFQRVKPSTLVLSNVTVRSYRTPGFGCFRVCRTSRHPGEVGLPQEQQPAGNVELAQG
ncbi:hypothetical protein MRX96_022673 [Rhipicephalus microplus]